MERQEKCVICESGDQTGLVCLFGKGSEDLLVMNFPMVKQPVHFYGPKRTGAPQNLLDCEKQIRDVDAFVIVSAEYNNSIPASLKNFLDTFPDGSYGFKPSGLVCYSMGPYGGYCSSTSLRTVMGVLASPCVSRVLAIPFVQDAIDEDGKAINEKLNSEVDPMLQQLEWMANATKNHRLKAGLPTSSFMFGS
ncbi:quinone reductase-like [Saccostrea cucullata]|uniref:quinone reductase-like n=1 Tax=Saccostrea cuccullata TaxID=36930 RepID=UPI002ED6A1D8